MEDDNMADRITTALDFWQRIYDEKVATVKFVKKDGTIRIMKFTLDFARIPRDKHPKKVDLVQIMKRMNEKGIIHVFDLEKQNWRSVPFETVDWVEFAEDRDQPDRHKVDIPAPRKKK
jgi:hypothetical protein